MGSPVTGSLRPSERAGETPRWGICSCLPPRSAPVLVSQIHMDTFSCFSDCLNPAAVSVGIAGGLVYVGSVGTTYGEVFGFDYRTRAHTRLVSLMSYGGALDETVLNFAFYQSEMFVGGNLFAVADRRSDISQPRNVINLFFPGFPGGAGSVSRAAATKSAVFTHPKMKLKGKRWIRQSALLLKMSDTTRLRLHL